jgi:hypothetical protein
LAERSKRNSVDGDSRWFDRQGKELKVRDGYDNPDPWYDGRGQDFTIVDAPRAGSMLSPEEIESIFLKFGAVQPDEVNPLV